ncbi:MAG: TetR/AcrR family transcriptional regulator [Spirochaetes bacterium]|nr:TetR/AcrR family transcriptional regulator [Spirochaetota bacterium]
MKDESRKNWERQQRKNRIVDFAQEVFFSKGYDSATIEEIAKAAGYNKRTLYMYFKDKDDLFLAVALRGQELFHSYLKDAVSHSPAGKPKIQHLSSAFYRFSSEYPDFFNLIMTYELRLHIYYNPDYYENRESYAAQCQLISNQCGQIVIDAIAADKSEKMISSHLTPQQLMLIFWGQVFGVMQIILTRKKLFRNFYGITHEDLYNEFITMGIKSLQQ